MNRLDRRIRLLRGRRRGSFDGEQRLVETGRRAKTARALRMAVRRGQWTILHEPRWSASGWVVDDLAIDLAVADRPVDLRVVTAPKAARGRDAWPLVLEDLSTGLALPRRRAAAALSREGFRQQVAGLFRDAARMGRGLVLRGGERLGYDVVEDLYEAWRTAQRRVRAMPMVVATRSVPPLGTLAEATRTSLADPSPTEAIELLAELLGAGDLVHLARIVDAVGTVPAFLLAVARAGAPTSPEEVRKGLGSLHDELAQAMMLAQADGRLEERLEALLDGPQPVVPALDRALEETGLVAVDDRRAPAVARLRTPLVAAWLRHG